MTKDYFKFMDKFYVDSCIWLNLFKKEGDASKGVPYWKIARTVLKRISFSENAEALYTSAVLNEIERATCDAEIFRRWLSFIKSSKRFIFVDCTKEDYSFARKLESESCFSISFVDCINIAVCLRLGALLVTRDKLLMDFARGYIEADKPEDLTI